MVTGSVRPRPLTRRSGRAQDARPFAGFLERTGPCCCLSPRPERPAPPSGHWQVALCPLECPGLAVLKYKSHTPLWELSFWRHHASAFLSPLLAPEPARLVHGQNQGGDSGDVGAWGAPSLDV